MTRINLLPVTQLTDQHLVAEYREILRMPKYLSRSLNTKRGVRIDDLPPVFTLNTGHVKFFYNKGRFVRDRFWELRGEMHRRGFTPTIVIDMTTWPKHLMGDYTPSAADVAISRQRIDSKLRNPRDGYTYRFHGVDVDPKHGADFINHLPQEVTGC